MAHRCGSRGVGHLIRRNPLRAAERARGEVYSLPRRCFGSLRTECAFLMVLRRQEWTSTSFLTRSDHLFSDDFGRPGRVSGDDLTSGGPGVVCFKTTPISQDRGRQICTIFRLTGQTCGALPVQANRRQISGAQNDGQLAGIPSARTCTTGFCIGKKSSSAAAGEQSTYRAPACCSNRISRFPAD